MNNLSKIEPHALRLEAAADRMDQAGIGGHETRGHAAVLRQMAGAMRADAARGRLAYRYDAPADTMSASASGGGTATRGRPAVTVQQLLEADPTAARRVNAARHAAKRLGYILPLDRHVDLNELDAATRGRDLMERLSLKSNLAALRLIA